MNQLWFQVLAVMIVGSIIKYLVYNQWAWVVIDLAVLGIAYLILRRDRFIDMQRSMIFLGGLTAVNILVDFNILDVIVANLAVLALLAYIMFGRNYNNRRRR